MDREKIGNDLIRIKKEVERIGCIEKRWLRSFLDINIHLCLGFAANFIYYGVEKRIHSTEFIVWSVEDIIVLNYSCPISRVRYNRDSEQVIFIIAIVRKYINQNGSIHGCQCVIILCSRGIVEAVDISIKGANIKFVVFIDSEGRNVVWRV